MFNEIPLVFHNVSNYDYQITTIELANQFEGQFKCLAENTEKYKSVSVPMEKEVSKIENDRNKRVITKFYKI